MLIINLLMAVDRDMLGVPMRKLRNPELASSPLCLCIVFGTHTGVEVPSLSIFSQSVMSVKLSDYLSFFDPQTSDLRVLLTSGSVPPNLECHMEKISWFASLSLGPSINPLLCFNRRWPFFLRMSLVTTSPFITVGHLSPLSNSLSLQL